MTALGDSALMPFPEPPTDLPPLRGADPVALAARTRRMVEGTDWASLAWPELLEQLARLGAVDSPSGRVAEGHVDAVRILAQAGRVPVPGALYGVWASRSRGTGPAAAPEGDGWRVAGTLRFASGVGALDRSLVTAVDPDGRHLLLDLQVGTWAGDEDSWGTSAMAGSRSLTVEVDELVPASAVVGTPGWYLQRPGFLPGGVGVAAVWWGATTHLVALARRAGERAPATPERAMRWGSIRARLTAAGATLTEAGRVLEELLPTGSRERWDAVGEDARARLAGLSAETRAVVGDAARQVLVDVRELAGAAGMAYESELVGAWEDLALYVAQHPSDRATTGLGTA